MQKNFLIIMLFTLAVASPTFAGDGFPALAEPNVQLTTPGGDGPESLDSIGPNTYGITDLIYYRLSAANFSPQGDGTYGYSLGGYIYRMSGTFKYWAAVTLPDGALLHGARLYFYDDSTDFNITMWLERYYGDSTNAFEVLATAQTSGTPGYGNLLMGIDHTINNQAGAYAIVIDLPTSSGTGFKGVRLFYQLQVSPAPVSATFSDVPVGHWAHQYVEALYDSGITEGYDDGTFRPGQPVLRGQMAAFLAKALGLHW